MSISPPPPRPPAERFAGIMEGVYHALAAQGLRGALMGKLLILVCGRLRRAGAHVLRIAAMLQAGTLRRRPPRPPAPPAPRKEAAAAAAGNPAKPALPQAFGWLPRMVRAVCFGRSQLTYLLNQPDMAELIAAAPPVAHHLRPICRMLGVKPPPGLFPQRRRPRAPAPPAPAAAKQENDFPRRTPRPARSRPSPPLAPPPRKRSRPNRPPASDPCMWG